MNLETENKDTYVYNNCIEKFKMFQNEQLLIFRGLFYIGDYIDDSEWSRFNYFFHAIGSTEGGKNQLNENINQYVWPALSHNGGSWAQA